MSHLAEVNRLGHNADNVLRLRSENTRPSDQDLFPHTDENSSIDFQLWIQLIKMLHHHSLPAADGLLYRLSQLPTLLKGQLKPGVHMIGMKSNVTVIMVVSQGQGRSISSLISIGKFQTWKKAMNQQRCSRAAIAHKTRQTVIGTEVAW